MSDIPEEQIEGWLKKLERESWQLELLVSAFTIFLLIGANSQFDEFLLGLRYQYNLNSGALSIVYVFLILIERSIMALTICLIVHLMLRGFWIGTIGLRSVQANIDFTALNYNDFFTEKLKKKVISLDRLVIRLDEICSVIFAFSFLVISILIAFGMYLILLGVFGIGLSYLINVLSGTLADIAAIFSLIIFLTLLLTGLMYMIDYFTLGFFKKVKWLSKIYYPFYRFYNVVTLSGLSRSIYYYLISKFSKRRIRMVYALVGGLVLSMMLVSFDQFQYFPNNENGYFVTSQSYDDMRRTEDFVEDVSISSSFIDKPHFQVFLRYNPRDNALIRSHCSDFEPAKADGLDWKLTFETQDGNLNIQQKDYSREDFKQLIDCQRAIYQLSINDSIYDTLSYHFFIHPHKEQRGLLVTIPTDDFNIGENRLEVMKLQIDSVGQVTPQPYAELPFWYNPD